MTIGQEYAVALRNQWIERHSGVVELRQKIVDAKAHRAKPEWSSNPTVFLQNARDAGVQVARLQKQLKELQANLRQSYNQQCGVDDDSDIEEVD